MPFRKQNLVFTCLQYKPFENTVGKGETAHNEFSALLKNFPPFSSNLKLLFANSFIFEGSKICHLGMG